MASETAVGFVFQTRVFRMLNNYLQLERPSQDEYLITLSSSTKHVVVAYGVLKIGYESVYMQLGLLCLFQPYSLVYAATSWVAMWDWHLL